MADQPRIIEPTGLQQLFRIDYEELLNAPAGSIGTANTTYYCRTMVDTRTADKLTLIVTSTLNQSVTVQVVGHPVANQPSDALNLVNVGASQSIGAGNTTQQRATFGVDLATAFFSYFAVTVATGATAPTSGNLQVYALVRRVVGTKVVS